MMVLIVGRTASGKDHLKSILEQMGLTAVLSRTTRPRRSADEDTHVFLTEDEAAEQLPFAVAHTNINGYDYFATPNDIESNDIYIVDPKGVEDLTTALPDVEFKIIYVYAPYENRETMACLRADDPEAERQVFRDRNDSEDESFTAFEEKIAHAINGERVFANNVYALDFIPNDYQPKTLEDAAVKAFEDLLYHENLEHIVNALVEEEITPTYEGQVLVETDGKVDQMSVDHAASSMCANDEEAAKVINYYLRHFRL